VIVCDVCANVHAPAYAHRVSMSQPGADSGTGRHTKVSEANIEICVGCRLVVWQSIEATLAAAKKAANARATGAEEG